MRVELKQHIEITTGEGETIFLTLDEAELLLSGLSKLLHYNIYQLDGAALHINGKPLGFGGNLDGTAGTLPGGKVTVT